MFQVYHFNDACSASDVAQRQVRWSRWVHKDLGYFKVLFSAFAWRDWIQPRKSCQDNRLSGRGSNNVPSECKSVALLLHHAARLYSVLKVKYPAFFLTEHHAMKVYWEVDLGTRWRW